MTSRLPDPDEVQRLDGVKTYVLNHLNQDLTTAQLAKKAALGQKKFTDSFRQVFGVSPKEYVKRSRLLTARFLLTHTDQPIKAIARRCGYAHYKNFITAYRAAYGRTPYAERSRQRP